VNALNDKERGQLSTGEFLLTDFNGKHTNGHANSKNGHSDESLVERLRRASADELAAAGREIGVGVIFDTMIVPFLDSKA
jgi:hypothetical protein